MRSARSTTAMLRRALESIGIDVAADALADEADGGAWACAEILTASRGFFCDHRHDVVEQVGRLVQVMGVVLTRHGAAVALRMAQEGGEPWLVMDRAGRRHRYALGVLAEDGLDSAVASVSALVEPDFSVVALAPYDRTDSHGFALLAMAETSRLRLILGKSWKVLFRALPPARPLLPSTTMVNEPAAGELPTGPAPSERGKAAPARGGRKAKVRIADGPLPFGYELHRGRVRTRHRAVVRMADPPRFRPLDRSWAVDAQHVFFCGLVVEGLDVASLQVLDRDFARDSRHVAYGSHLLREADPAGFERLTPAGRPGGRFARDGQHVYWFEDLDAVPRIVEGADPRSFGLTGRGFGRDKSGVYHGGTKLPRADPATWEALHGGLYSRSGMRAYYRCEALAGAEGPTLVPFAERLARDRGSFFFNGRPMAVEHAHRHLAAIFVFEGVLRSASLTGAIEEGEASEWQLVFDPRHWVRPPCGDRDDTPRMGSPWLLVQRSFSDDPTAYEGSPRLWFLQCWTPAGTSASRLKLIGPSDGAWDFGDLTNRGLVDEWFALLRS